MNLVGFNIIYVLCSVFTSIQVSASSAVQFPQDKLDYDDLDRSRRNTVSIGNTLMKSPECMKYTMTCKAQDDLDLVTCINNKKRTEDSGTASELCINKVKTYVIKFLKYLPLHDVGDTYCSKDWPALTSCGSDALHQDAGLLMCMFDNLNNVRTTECTGFIQRLKLVPFLSVETMMPFLRECQRDMELKRCVAFKSDRQMKILHCLQSHIEEVTTQCRDEVLYLSELQSDLVGNYGEVAVPSCSKETELFCSEVARGNLDQIYHCLSTHKDAIQFSPQALFGVSYSLMGSAIWTMFAFSTSTCLTGSVYGLVSAVSGLSQTVSPAIVGTLIDSFDYSAAICYYLVNASVALVCIAVTWMIDVKRDGILSLTVQERSARQQLLIRSESEEDISQDWNPATVEFDAP